MSTLFEITNEFLELYELATEDEEAFADTLESLNFDLSEKAAGYVHVIHRLDMEIAKAKELSSSFADKAKVRENCKKRLMERIQAAMVVLDRKEIPAGDYTIKMKGNGGLQPLKITGDVPDNMTKIEIKPDNDKIRKYLKDHECEWAHLEPRGKHLEIK